MKLSILFTFCVFFSSCNFSREKKETIAKEKVNSEIYHISNDTLNVSVKTKGAELSSIKYKKKEYLWQGDSLFWHEQSPILFPIVGKLKDNEYNYNGKTYKMKFHGFGRSQKFKIIKKSKKSITFSLETNSKIIEQYPFDFELRIKYTLKNKILKVGYLVVNLSNTEPMYFSIGAHPGFNCPLENNHTRDEYQLAFDEAKSPLSLNKTKGLFNDNRTQYFKEPGILELRDSTFSRGALVFKPNPFNKATLIHKPTGKSYLSVTFEGFPYFGIWSAKNQNNNITPFVCIEPWFGMADFDKHDKDLTTKKGIQKLEPHEEFNSSFTIEIL